MQIRPLLAKFDTAAGYLQSPLLLVIRLYWGWQFAQTGWGKLTHLDRTAGFFESLHLPLPKLNAVLAGSTECFGGVLLALGLFARPVAVPLSFTMIVAYATADPDALHSLFKLASITEEGSFDKFTGAAPFLFLSAALVVLAFGPGRFSLDALLGRKPAAPAK